MRIWWSGLLGNVVSMAVFSFGRLDVDVGDYFCPEESSGSRFRWPMSVARLFVVKDKDVLLVGARPVRIGSDVFCAVSGVGTVLCCFNFTLWSVVAMRLFILGCVFFVYSHYLC